MTTSTAQAFAVLILNHRIGLLPIVDPQHHLIGVVGIRHLLSLELLDFVRFLTDIDFVHDFGTVETTRPGMSLIPIGLSPH
jgi:CBS-domain-containing membrane protein